MALREITAVAPEVRMVELSHLSMVAGDPERAVVAVYLGIEGDMPGHILMAYQRERWRWASSICCWTSPRAPRPSLARLEISALAEAGNVCRLLLPDDDC